MLAFAMGGLNNSNLAVFLRKEILALNLMKPYLLEVELKITSG